MVIIKRDDFNFLINSTGVKMPMTPANENISTQPPGNGAALIPPISPSNQAANISTIKRDSSQQQLQQLQQYTQQQNQTLLNSNQQLAKAQLVCRPNSHPFPVSLIGLTARPQTATNSLFSFHFRAERFFLSLISPWKSVEPSHAQKSAITMPFSIVKFCHGTMLSCGMRTASSI